MSVRRSIASARDRCRWIARKLGAEIRATRRSQGISQRDLASAAGTSQPTVSRLERGFGTTTLATLTAVAEVLGLDLAVRLFPSDRSRLRDRLQVRMVETILGRSSATWHASTEVSVAAEGGDRRAIDLVLASALEVLAIEAQREIGDAQADTRQHRAKRDVLQSRERRPVRYVLALPDTHRMHELVREHATLMSALFPVSSRRAWHAIRSGAPLGGDALLWVPMATTTRASAGDSLVNEIAGMSHVPAVAFSAE